MRLPVLASIFAFGFLLSAASCSSSDDNATSKAATEAGIATDTGADASTDARPQLDATCDARIVECKSTPTQPSPTVNEPEACGAPEFDAYSTNNSNEQVEAACNDFCVAQNPAYADAGTAFVGCNQTPAEQALGTGAFHCVCAP